MAEQRNGMRYYTDRDVFEAGLERMRFIFSEFDDVIVHTSGGKDSTVTVQLALTVARELGRLPLKLMFLDQEVEHTQTIEQMEHNANNPDFDLYWLQIPYEFENGLSTEHPIFTSWEPEEEDKWLRPKRVGTIHENVYGTRNFYKLFDAFCKHHFAGQSIARIGGVRCEESPNRRLALTAFPSYKWVTWASAKGSHNKACKDHMLFYPIYDWSYQDVWKAIHDNDWRYNELYDLQYQYGVAIQNMRVSSMIHETAMYVLMYLQEVDRPLWGKLCKRVDGVACAGQLKMDAFKTVELPYMFATWKEYRDHLLKNLVHDPKQRDSFLVTWRGHESGLKKVGIIPEEAWDREVHGTEAKSILIGDHTGVTLNTSAVSLKWSAISKGAESGS